jgi:hypothetical protein
MMIKLFEKVILNIVQRHTDERGLLTEGQFRFHAHHRTTSQCMRLTDHMTLNFNNNKSTVVVYLDIETAFDTTWHTGFIYIYIYMLSKLEFLTHLIKLISSFLSNIKFYVSV